ncbi:MAG: hypothetical protein FJ217_13605 [Ignavibacteria bacterium]|nr:hypothetical protein [Ignavibacteria bacterium]
MTSEIMLYVGSGVIILWGLAHIVPTKAVVRGFGQLSSDNKLIITMEWIAEGLTLCFVGALVLVVTVAVGTQGVASLYVFRACAIMLIALAVLSLFTGAQTSVMPMKICPFVKGSVALLFFVASIIGGSGV